MQIGFANKQIIKIMIPNQMNERTGMRIGEPLIFTFICQSDALIGKKIDVQNVYGKKMLLKILFSYAYFLRF